jgi:hypothetical protein
MKNFNDTIGNRTPDLGMSTEDVVEFVKEFPVLHDMRRAAYKDNKRTYDIGWD